MTKPHLTLKHLNYLYLAIHLISYALIIGMIVFVVQDCYLFYLKENSVFQQIKGNGASTAHLDLFMKTIFTGFFWGAVKIVVTCFIVLLTKFILLRIPVSSNYLINLDKNHDISSILGRYLSYHFRRHTYINFKTLVYLNQEAEYEKYIISKNSTKNTYSYFLKKYDSYFEEDLK